MQTWDKGFTQLSRILPTLLVLRWGYENTEKVLYYLVVVFFIRAKNRNRSIFANVVKCSWKYADLQRAFKNNSLWKSWGQTEWMMGNWKTDNSRECLWCSYHIVSSVICYWTDARQHWIYLFYMRKKPNNMLMTSSIRLSSNRSWV